MSRFQNNFATTRKPKSMSSHIIRSSTTPHHKELFQTQKKDDMSKPPPPPSSSSSSSLTYPTHTAPLSPPPEAETSIDNSDSFSQAASDFQRRIYDVDDQSVGVNRHTYSPESLRRILDQQERVNAAFCQQLSGESCNATDDNDNGHNGDNGDNDDDGRGNHNETNGKAGNNMLSMATLSGAAGFFTKWMHVQRIKRQKEALERAVEEQRRILIRQSSGQMRRRQRRENQRPGEFHSYMEGVDEGLEGNQTFQNMTATNRNVSSLPFCGAGDYVDDDDHYSYGDESRENFEQYMNTVRESEDCHTEWNDDDGDGDDDDDDDDDEISYTSRSQDEQEGAFMIGNACHSVSGQGVAVQLQLLDNKPKKVNTSNGSHHDIKILHEKSTTVPLILSPEQMKTIATLGLPASIMFSKWKRLYCLQRDGDSFDKSFLRKVQGHARSLLVIQTTNYEILGGYSNSPWESQGGSIGAAFYGSCQASLFKIDKKTNDVLVYNWTGNNRYVQVCDVHAKLLAFGGGGKDGSFGLCVEDDFSVGTTGRCETFNNDPLCEEGRFEILNVECWGFITGF